MRTFILLTASLALIGCATSRPLAQTNTTISTNELANLRAEIARLQSVITIPPNSLGVIIIMDGDGMPPATAATAAYNTVTKLLPNAKVGIYVQRWMPPRPEPLKLLSVPPQIHAPASIDNATTNPPAASIENATTNTVKATPQTNLLPPALEQTNSATLITNAPSTNSSTTPAPAR